MPRALVLEPTRELADQVSESFDSYGKYTKLSHALLIGGTSMDEQIKKLDRGVDVLIATPGRLMDHFERGRMLLSQVNILVIDEADRMLDMGFIPDVEEICKKLPFTRQTLFYSATMPPEIQRLTDQFLHNPVRVEVSRPATTATNITQEVVMVPANDWAKREALRRLIREAEPTLNNAIVFCNRKRDVDVVAKSLAKHGFDAAPDPWRSRPVAAHQDAGPFPRRRTQDPGGQRCRGARPGRAGRQPCLQFRRADPCRRLCPPHRPHRPRRPQRRRLYAGHARATANISRRSRRSPARSWPRREMMDIEVREDTPPAPRRSRRRPRRPRPRRQQWPRRQASRPPPAGRQIHDQVAGMEPTAVRPKRPLASATPRSKHRARRSRSASISRAPTSRARNKPRQEQRPQQRRSRARTRSEKRERGGQRAAQ